MHKKLFIYGLTVTLFFSFSARLSGEDRYIDSLKEALNKSMPDTQRVELLLGLSNSLGCEDTINKVRYAEEALQISKKIEWHKGGIITNDALGAIYNSCVKDNITAIKYYEGTRDEAIKINDSLSIAFALQNIAFCYKSLGQYSKAIQYYRESITIQTDPGEKAGAIATLGTIFNNLGDYSAALSYYQQALKVIEEHQKDVKEISEDDIGMHCGLLINTGDINTTISQYDRALANYDSAIYTADRIKNENNKALLKAWAYKSIGHLYQEKKDYDSAVKYYSVALNNYVKFPQDKAEILNALAEIYLAEGKTERALQYAEQSKTLFEKIIVDKGSYDDASSLANTYITLGRIQVLNKKYTTAVNYLHKALNIAEKTGAVDKQSDAWLQLSIAHDSLRQPAKALEAYRNYVSTRDSVFNIDKAKEIALLQVKDKFTKDSLNQAITLGYKIKQQQLQTYSGYVALLIVITFSFILMRGYFHVRKTNITIEGEKRKSDRLLLNILPADVATELKEKGNVHAKEFENVTVMFTDFVNFTAAGERLGAQQLVHELDACFVAFDEIIAQYNIEKIKTVGDAYLAVSGMPKPNAQHAEDMIHAAIAIRNFMLQRKAQMGDNTFEVRIGVHSGPVVAGIVGVRKFAYDIWGDTVNIAARMEQSGIAGRVNMSDVTYELVKDKFLCTYRGEIDAKNKGKMRMYFVE